MEHKTPAAPTCTFLVPLPLVVLFLNKLIGKSGFCRDFLVGKIKIAMKCVIEIYKAGTDFNPKVLPFDTLRDGRKKLAEMKRQYRDDKKHGNVPTTMRDRIIDLRVNGIAVDGFTTY